jgi:putative mRNA 3-end processing factor
MELSILGGAEEVGRSAFLIKGKKNNVLLDYGVQLARVPIFPIHVMPKEIDGILLSHAHLDHSGATPLFSLSNNNILYGTDVTLELSELLIKDFIKISGFYLPFEYIDLIHMLKNAKRLSFGDKVGIGEFNAHFLEAGHIPGASTILLEAGNKRLLYTGDFNLKDTPLLRKSEKDFGELDAVITESTYATANHPSSFEVEKSFIEYVKKIVEEKGVVLVPAFSVGRAQEIACVLKKHSFPYTVSMDGMALKTNEILLRHQEYLRDSDLFRKSIENIELITSWSQRRRLIKTPSVIISPAGMLVGGASVFYNSEISKNPRNAITIVSFQIPGTPGRTLLEKKIAIIKGKPTKVKADVRRFDFSSHSGKDDLFDLFKKIEGSPRVFTVHGDRANCKKFADDLKNEIGLDAVAPKIGDTFSF